MIEIPLDRQCFRCKHPYGEHDEGECRGGQDSICHCIGYDDSEPLGYVCSCGDNDPICEKELAAMAAIKADTVAHERLRTKCQWEGMTLYGVLREWGDPRLWNDVVAAKEACEGHGPPACDFQRNEGAEGGEE